MWALWYINARLARVNPLTLAKAIANAKDPVNRDPLIVIKKYIWCLLSCEGLLDMLSPNGQEVEFFKYHFPCIWSNGRSLTAPFVRYRIPGLEQHKCTTLLNTCLLYSVMETKLLREPNTPVPLLIKRTYRLK